MSEARPTKCAHCAKPTTLHLTKIIEGKVQKLGICSACPNAANLKAGAGFDLIEGPAASKPLPAPLAVSEVACPNCGLTPGDFKEIGRLGCSRCYEVFAEKLEPMITKLHKGATHQGKWPKGRQRVVSPEEIQLLKRRLEEYVSREEYELAAVVRDQIRQLES